MSPPADVGPPPGVTLVKGDVEASEQAVNARFAAAGLQPRRWTAEPGHRFEPHDHPQTKVLFCLRGSITFRSGGSSYPVEPGDRLEVGAGTIHQAEIGPNGVECVEAYR